MDRAALRPDVPPASLPSAALARRLAELCSDERNLQVEFLRHLLEFDDRRAYAGAGYPSLWAYCTEVLHLREGATWRRIEAMKLLRRFPSLEAQLRDGRLCLTTVNLLGPVLTEENQEELVGRAAFLSKVETQRLVAAVRDAQAAADGRGGAPVQPGPWTLSLLAPAAQDEAATACASRPSTDAAAGSPAAVATSTAATPAAACAPSSPLAARKPELRPTGKDAWSLRVTLDDAARAELLELAALTAHATRGDLAAVLRDAVRAALARQRKRRGAARSERTRKAAQGPAASGPMVAAAPSAGELIPPANEPAAADGPARANPRAIPTAVREAVWARDDGRCAWVSPEGRRCGSSWKLQLGHVRPVAFGGQPTVHDLRLECATHNQYEAPRVFGRRHMARFQPGLDFRRRK